MVVLQWSQRPLSNIANISHMSFYLIKDALLRAFYDLLWRPKAFVKLLSPGCPWISEQLVSKLTISQENSNSQHQYVLETQRDFITYDWCHGHFILSLNCAIPKSSKLALRRTKSAAFEVWIWVQKCEWVKFEPLLFLDRRLNSQVQAYMPPLPHVIVSATRYNV